MEFISGGYQWSVGWLKHSLTAPLLAYSVDMHDWKLIITFFSCHHSLCGTVGQRVADLAGRAPAERPASTGGASRVSWSLSFPTHTRAPTPAVGSILWTSKSTCKCLCSTCLNAMAPPFTSLNSAVRTLPWLHIIKAIRKMMRLRRWALLCLWPYKKHRLLNWLLFATVRLNNCDFPQNIISWF